LLKTAGLPDNAVVRAASGRAAQAAADRRLPAGKRAEAIDFLSIVSPVSHAVLLERLLTAAEPLEVQLSALHALRRIRGTRVSQYLLRQWNDMTPAIQDEAINTFLEDTGRIALLLDALETGKIKATSIGWPRSVQLMAQDNKVLRNRSRQLLTKNEAEEKKVSQAYQPVLSMKGDPERGRTIFAQRCATCHQVRGKAGASFGPDLGTVHNWSPAAIMTNILSPDLSISSGYDLWIIDQKNGESMQGIIATETPTTITVRTSGQAEKTIRREDIRSLRALNLSAMPSGLEKQINQQEMADLLAFLKQNK
jgi:putative heme-binding domain-containing protein